MAQLRDVLAVSDSTATWSVVSMLKQHREEVVLVVSDAGELLGLLRRDVVCDAAERTPTLPVRELKREDVVAMPARDEARWTVAFAEVQPANSRLG